MNEGTPLPELIGRANQLPYDYADGDGIEFEPFDAFLTTNETERWFRAWTGNPVADGSPFRIFGQDASGGYAAIWTARPNCELLEQPVIFLGSEGEMAVVAANFLDYLWVLAAGLGPCEAACFPDAPRRPQPALAEFAKQNAGDFKSVAQVLASAASEFPDFRRLIESQCR